LEHELFAAKAKAAKTTGTLSHASEGSLSPSFGLWLPNIAKPGTQRESI